MNPVDLYTTASALPTPWNSLALGRVGTATVKVLRMDGRPLPAEAHDDAELLLVLDGRLELLVDGAEVAVGPGELYLVPAGARHAVRPGSTGTLVLVEAAGAAGVGGFTRAEAAAATEAAAYDGPGDGLDDEAAAAVAEETAFQPG
ncbi:cupin domain-containing protein [Kitasatospora purpeofusca]|uniref:cupin domain-containing protein n=1 Tax=Kitasatospora purpeofusca TaxID=67352 RepID=UPI0036D34A89